jgi:TonB-dependent receptor
MKLVLAMLCSVSAAAIAGGASAQAPAAATQATGSIVGHVNAPGAVVTLKGTGSKTTAAPDGSYALRDVPVGPYTLAVTGPSGAEIDARIVVMPGRETHRDIAVAGGATALDEIVVLAQRTPIAIARLAQQQAPNLVNVQTYQEIKKLPDISVAEAVRRVPGISLETDEGEGRYVNIRGLDADLNSTTFGGLRLPPTNNASPFGGYRAVTLDSIPIGLVGALTITKSNLPSQDAEALGGTIEITPKTAPRGGEPFIQGSIGTGYEALHSTPITDVAVTLGGHFGGPDGFFSGGPFSIVLTAAYNEDHRKFDDLEPAYFNDPQGVAGSRPYNAISNIQQRDYELNRKRHAYGIDLGYEPDANNRWYIRAFDAGYGERYKRPYLSLTPDGGVTTLASGQLQDTLAAPGAIMKNFRDEYETSRDRIFVIGGRNAFGANIIDYRVGYTEGTYHKPYDYNSFFAFDPAAAANSVITYNNSGPGHVPVYTLTGADYTNPTNYSLADFNNSRQDNFDRELSFAGNYERLANFFGSEDGSFKFGFSVRLRHKQTLAAPTSYPTIPALSLTSVASSGNETYYNGLYQNGVDIAPGYLQSQLGSGTVQPGDQISADQQFLDVKENVYAGYGQYQATWGKFGLLAGVRVENTDDSSRAFQTQTTADGVTTAAPISAKTNYTNVFPSVQLKYEIQHDLIARATYSTAIGRPGFNQSNVSLSVDLGSGIISQGNPNLKPITANSFDVSIEKYLPGAGIISAGLFYKDFSNYIVARTVPASSIPGGLPFYHSGNLQFLTFLNAGRSYARGVELNFNHRFTSLPGAFGGLGLAANFTYVDSRFEIRPGEYSALPSTSKYTYNAAVFYERGPLNLRLSAYSASADLFGFGSDKTSDVYNATRTSMDFGGSYDINKHLELYFAAKNLLDTPHAFYQGTKDRPIQREFYGQTYQLGVRFDY